MLRQLLDFAPFFEDYLVLFEKLVEQRCVHRVVANGVNLPFCIACDEIGIYLFRVLGNEAELRRLVGIDFLLVTKRDRLQPQDCFARLVTLRYDNPPWLTFTIGGCYCYVKTPCKV